MKKAELVWGKYSVSWADHTSIFSLLLQCNYTNDFFLSRNKAVLWLSEGKKKSHCRITATDIIKGARMKCPPTLVIGANDCQEQKDHSKLGDVNKQIESLP